MSELSTDMRAVQRFKSRSKSFSLYSKIIFCLGAADFLWVMS